MAGAAVKVIHGYHVGGGKLEPAPDLDSIPLKSPKRVVSIHLERSKSHSFSDLGLKHLVPDIKTIQVK